jgi:3-deoxy-D-manno-octulosonic-acid transferase
LRHFYSLMLYLMLPWVLGRLWWRGRRVPAYRRHWRERFGWLAPMPAQSVVWIHAVSVGEVRAAQPLVRSLQQRWPHKAFLLTTTTPAGRETVRRLFAGSLRCAYLPWDLPGPVRRFLSRVSPEVAIVLETEIWPNLYRAASLHGIPLLLVNARLSPSSMRGYARLRGLTRATLGLVERIAAQTDEDAQRFLDLGAGRQQLTVSGNLKFDAQLPTDFATRSARWRDRLARSRHIWIAGSTHPGEETPLLDAHRRLLDRFPDTLLLLAPRHPERAGDVAALCERAGIDHDLLSRVHTSAGGDRVLIVDVLGELAYLYGVADVAFVGGSLVDAGGHNPVEAVLAGAPVVTGPYLDNFAFVYRKLAEQKAVCSVSTGAALARTVDSWFADARRRQAIADAARGVVQEQRGALQRILEQVDSVLQRRQ